MPIAVAECETSKQFARLSHDACKFRRPTMSDSDSNTPEKRRSQRERKTFKPFTSRKCNLLRYVIYAPNRLLVDSNTNKRKRAESDTEDVDSGLEDNHSEQEEIFDEENEDEEDFKAPKVKSKAASKSNAKAGAGPAGKKPRTTKNVVPKPPKTTTRKPRKGKGGGDAFDATRITKETKITADNPLFSTCFLVLRYASTF